MNPNMHSKKLQGAFEKMGFTDVTTVIASGNVVFDSPKKPAALESLIEKSLPKLLGFSSTTIIRSAKEIEALLKKNPLKKSLGNPKLYPVVTFVKKTHAKRFPTRGAGYVVAADYGTEMCTVITKSDLHSSDFMRALEKHHAKGITTRTWMTVERIFKKMAG